MRHDAYEAAAAAGVIVVLVGGAAVQDAAIVDDQAATFCQFQGERELGPVEDLVEGVDRGAAVGGKRSVEEVVRPAHADGVAACPQVTVPVREGSAPDHRGPARRGDVPAVERERGVQEGRVGGMVVSVLQALNNTFTEAAGARAPDVTRLEQ